MNTCEYKRSNREIEIGCKTLENLTRSFQQFYVYKEKRFSICLFVRYPLGERVRILLKYSGLLLKDRSLQLVSPLVNR